MRDLSLIILYNCVYARCSWYIVLTSVNIIVIILWKYYIFMMIIIIIIFFDDKLLADSSCPRWLSVVYATFAINNGVE